MNSLASIFEQVRAWPAAPSVAGCVFLALMIAMVLQELWGRASTPVAALLVLFAFLPASALASPPVSYTDHLTGAVLSAMIFALAAAFKVTDFDDLYPVAAVTLWLGLERIALFFCFLGAVVGLICVCYLSFRLARRTVGQVDIEESTFPLTTAVAIAGACTWLFYPTFVWPHLSISWL